MNKLLSTLVYAASLLTCVLLLSHSASAEALTSGNIESADSIYLNGKIFTADPEQPWAEAVAVKDGKFITVGSSALMTAHQGGDTRTVDLGGKVVIPGLIDPHTHAFEDYHNRHFAFGVMDTSTPEKILAEVRAYARTNPDQAWIIGGIFPLGMFEDNNPHRKLLDSAVADRPVCLADQSAHSWWCNTKALEMGGIMDSATQLPEGAIVERDEDGTPSGTIREHAIGFMRRSIPPISAQEWVEVGRGFMHWFNSLGLTSVQLAAGNEAHLKAARALQDSGELSIRLVMAMNYGYFDSPETREEEYAFLGRANRYRSEFVDPGYVKIFVDGEPASRSAGVLTPYLGTEENHGLTYYQPDELLSMYRDFTSRGLGIMSHAIGDRSVRYVLDAIEATKKAIPDSGVRHHITHNGMIHPDDLNRFEALGLAIDLAPTMPISPPIREMMEPVIGKATVDNYANARAAIDAGARVAIGSDWQVAFLDPWRRIAYHVSRQDPENPDWGVMLPERALTVEESVQAYTLGPAYAINKDLETGSIEVGKYADMIILDRDIFEIEPLAIADTRVLLTLFAGREVYRHK